MSYRWFVTELYVVYSALLACIFACSIIKVEREGDRGMLKAWRPLLNILIP